MELIATVYIILLLVGVSTSLMLTIFTLRFLNIPGGRLFMLYTACLAIVIVAFAMLSVSRTPEVAFLWARVRFIGLGFSAALFLLFVLEYTGRSPRHMRLMVPVLLIVPVLTQIVLWSDQVVPLFFSEWSLTEFSFLTVERSRFGIWFQPHSLASFILLSMAYYVLLSSLPQAKPAQRASLVYLLIGSALLTLVAIIPGIIGNTLALNPTPIGVSFGLLLMTWGFLRHRAFDLLATAYHTVFTGLQDAVLVVDTSGAIIQFNDAAQQLLGQTAPLRPYQPLADVLAAHGYHQPVPTEADMQFEIGLNARAFDARLSRLRLSNGQTVGQVLVLRDITSYKATEAALRTSNERFNTLVESIPALMYQLRRTPDGIYRFEYLSPTLRKYNGLEPDDVVRDANLLFAQTHPDDVPSLIAAQEESAVHLTPFVWEGRTRPRGQLLWIRLESIPVRYPDGSVLWSGIQLDITARKEAEQALEKNEKLLARIAQMTPDTVYVFDRRIGAVTYRNHLVKEIFGYRPDEDLPANYLQALMHPDDFAVERSFGDRYATMRDDEIIETEYRWKHRTRGTIWLNVRELVYERAPDDTVTQIFGIIRDVTERRTADDQRQQLLAQLQAANQDLRDFAYVISHDLKAPLRGVSSIAHWLTEGYGEKLDADGMELLTLLVDRVQRMEQMINGVLEYSRIGREQEMRIAVDVNKIVREIVQDIVPAHRIEVVIEDVLPTLIIEPTRLRQIFQNLIDNAVKFIDKPCGCIRIGCRQESGMWQFRVQDNGRGIAPEHYERIFGLFQTLAPKDQTESTGVGLTITKRIIEVYGGTIWVESKRAEGTTFCFTLPMAARE